MYINSFKYLFQDRSNNFDFLRFILATLVIFAHSYSLLDPGAIREPLYRITSNQMGFAEVTVNFFFVISGFLITASWLRSRSLMDYLRRRALRIYPAVAAMSLICIFVVGPLSVRDVGSYFRSLSVLEYFTRITHFRLPDQPGVFSGLPEPNKVNGSLWTILYEYSCYILVALLGLLGGYRKRVLVLTLFVMALASYLFQKHHGLDVLVGGRGLRGLVLSPAWPRFLTYFASGMTFYLYRDMIPHSRKLFFLSTVAVLVSFRGGLFVTLPIFGSYLLLYAALDKSLKMQDFARNGDLSYGIYLYAFPVQQLLIQYFLSYLNPITLSLSAFAITYILATLSWRFVERPCLRLKGRPSSIQDRQRLDARAWDRPDSASVSRCDAASHGDRHDNTGSVPISSPISIQRGVR